MMASQQSNITSTSTPTSTPEQMLPPKSTTAIGMTTSNANPTVSTTTPVLTDVAQKCVDTAAEATTSTPTTTAGMTSSQIASTTSTTSTTTKTTTSSFNTVPTMAREAHRYHTVFAPITLVESLTKTNLLLVADVKSELQVMNKQISKQSAENLETRMEALEQGFIELREVVMQRTINNHLKGQS